MKKINKEENIILTTIVHPHPIVEIQLKINKDDVGEFIVHNKQSNEIETSFFLDKEKAEEIISMLQTFISTN